MYCPLERATFDCKVCKSKTQSSRFRVLVQTLNHELRGYTLTMCRNMDKGYSLLVSEENETLHHALMLSLFKSKWGTCILQSWVPSFNMDNPSTISFPTWVCLGNLTYEHHDEAYAIAEPSGEVIGMDTFNDTSKYPRFCITLRLMRGGYMHRPRLEGRHPSNSRSAS